MMNFVRDSTIGRVFFGAGGRTSLGEEIGWLGLARLLILCSPGQQVRYATRIACCQPCAPQA